MNKARPVIFGEVLFDVFPDGRSVLGGAPFNVAWHLAAFGENPLMVSGVGDDEAGETILSRMKSWDMDTSGIQVDPEHATGQVEVTFRNGEPSYDIVKERAYDFIGWPPIESLLEREMPSMLYHGTLATRWPMSANALENIATVSGVKTFVDVNLRDPWWNAGDLIRLLKRAHFVKLNEGELEVLFPGGSPETVCCKMNLEALIVTRGEKGASAFGPDGLLATAAPPEAVEVVDTVGAGDAFSAACIHGILFGWPWETTLQKAAAFAAKVCQVRGALLEDREEYGAFLKTPDRLSPKSTYRPGFHPIR